MSQLRHREIAQNLKSAKSGSRRTGFGVGGRQGLGSGSGWGWPCSSFGSLDVNVLTLGWQPDRRRLKKKRCCPSQLGIQTQSKPKPSSGCLP